MGARNPFRFLKETFRNFRTTGAVAPSSRFLARGIAKEIPETLDDDFKLLEVGSGTGSITIELARRMKGRGHLECWELSADFCKHLRKVIADEPAFAPMQGRIEVREGDILKLPREPRYNMVVSGLPFNCFRPEEVRNFLEHFRGILKPGGQLVWFEYVAIRKIQTPFVSSARRQQLRGISEVTGSFIKQHQHKQVIIPINLPPARIRHVRFG